ncbi:MAG: hypothetical protein HW413_3040 [Thermoleophilia bacterium]|nr:hypothetical protein [Thermoleophilia bacterium]
MRPVEQTPELAHLVRAIPLAYPEARVVHIVRDGRDVASSLLEKPWLRREQVKSDDAGLAYGSYARFWVEPDRREEFETASDARRAAWVWRRYITAARSTDVPLLEIRYERMTADPMAAAEEIGRYLDAPPDALGAALGRAHETSVGRYRTDLNDEQLANVLDEAGDLLRELGYT